MKKTALAHANIALVKYWGKRDAALNLPAVGSISMTLEALSTHTSVDFRDDLPGDMLILNGRPAAVKQEQRVGAFLDLFRREAGITAAAEVVSENNFPTGAGLASSASGFAALALAAGAAAGLPLSPTRLSELARRGSGSAARSIYGGFVEMKAGERSDGTDAVAVQLQNAAYWPLAMLILITSEQEKELGSTEGMNRTAQTSPYYPAWIASSVSDLAAMREAIAGKDFQRLGEIAEFSCFKMHGLALSADPAILYWNDLSVTLIHEVRRLRRQGYGAYVTMDAGPQVKVICLPEDAPKLQQQLGQIEGIQRILPTAIGGDARLIND
ncbi:MAG: diphosphomevalonate decarboxylase [Calditrichaeota bacterium]|nr:diphosphomevalonate decarboxylase [Calditrichota bacterium]